MATAWIVIAVLVAGLPDLMSLGSRGGFPTLFELLPAGLAALGATLYVAIASTAVLVIIVPISAGPGRQEPGRGLAKAVYTLFVVEVTLFIAAGVAKMGGNLLPAYGISLNSRPRHPASRRVVRGPCFTNTTVPDAPHTPAHRTR